MQKKKLIGIILLILLLFPYLRVEILTIVYGNQFEHLYNESGYIQEMKYFKVMQCKQENADVYYAAKGDDDRISCTLLYHFKKKSGEWKLDDWECIWSKSGSADKLIWPYYFH